MSDLGKIKELHTKLLSFCFDNKLTSDALNSLLETGFNDPRYPSIIVWVCKELSMLYGIEERLNPMKTKDDIEPFLFELSELLNVLGCATPQLLDGDLMTRFLTKEARILLLEFLLSHMKSARLTASHRLKCESQERLEKRKTEMEALASIITQLNIQNCLRQLQNRPDILLKTSLTQDEWLIVEEYSKLMNVEFAKRADLLLKRLDVTVDSFMWSDRIKKMEPEIMEMYKPSRERLEYSSKVYVEDIMAASSEYLYVVKASSAKVREKTRNDISSYLLKDVPADRGGRPLEIDKPEPEVPSWMQNRGGGRGGSRGRGRGYDNQYRGQRDYHAEQQVKREIRYADQRQQSYQGYQQYGQGGYDRQGGYHQGGSGRHGEYSGDRRGRGGNYAKRGKHY
uniref:Protein FAM98A n=1 Tax=Acrobeloides nanus TaxID=290746 RepID=A0A914ER77_9BILA